MSTDLSPSSAEPEAPQPRRVTFTKVLLTLVVLGILAMWVYAFGFASKKAAYRVDDDAWRARAEEVCTTYRAERLKLVDMTQGYIAEPTPAQMIERADLVDRATDILEAQFTEMTAVMPPSDRDRSLVAEYESYWRTVFSDRRAYTARLRNLQLEPYFETPIDGSPVTNLLTDFAVVNQIPTCSPPNELGGE
jgi:hypothetical protein